MNVRVKLRESDAREVALPSLRVEHRRKGRPRWLWWAIALVAAVTGVVVWPRLQPPPSVHVAAARVLGEERLFMAEGTVKSKRYEAGSATGSRIEWLGVEEGDRVRQGQPILRLVGPQVERAVEQARAGLASADHAVLRAQSLLAAKVVEVESRVIRAEAALRSAQANRLKAVQGARPEHVSQARSEVEQARVALEQAERQATRAERLAAEGAGSVAEAQAARASADIARQRWVLAQAALDDLVKGPSSADVKAADSLVETASADLAGAKASRIEVEAGKREVALAQAQRAEAAATLRRAEAEASNLVILSPADGVVSRVAAREGAVALPATIVIATRQDFHVEAEMGTDTALFLKPGFPVTVTSPEFGRTPFVGKVEQATAESEQKPDTTVRSRIVRVRIRVHDPDQRLIPGMDVDVQGTLRLPPTLCVPNGALVQERGETRVLVESEGRVTWRKLRIGPIGAEHTAVLEGLKAGERVVLSPSDGLKDGESVVVKP